MDSKTISKYVDDRKSKIGFLGLYCINFSVICNNFLLDDCKRVEIIDGGGEYLSEYPWIMGPPMMVPPRMTTFSNPMYSGNMATGGYNMMGSGNMFGGYTIIDCSNLMDR